jgi:hypothetical protein
LACLIAQGHVGIIKKLKKEYAADRIIKELGKLHPHFFPRPAGTAEGDSERYHLEIIEDGPFLKKKELIDLYGRCGSVLHRGSIKTINQNIDWRR